MLTVDGTNMIFGRLASQVSKKLMRGEDVEIINCEKIVIRGNPQEIAQRYLTKRGIRHKGTPERSPVWSKVPHMLVKRMIRGMLPRESSRGKIALKRLMIYSGNPKNVQGIRLDDATFDGVSKHLTIYELCKKIGYQG